MKTIKQFCSEHRACPEGQKWALARCKDMQEVWEKAKPDWLIWVATRPGVLTDRELRLFAVWCARQVQHLLTDTRSIRAIDVAERYANGDTTDEELAATRAAAWDAARDAARDADCDTAWAATRAAARDAAWAAAWAAACTPTRAAAWDAAWAAAWTAAWAAASAAAWAAAKDAAKDADCDAALAAALAADEAVQAEWLRNNTQPNFS